MTGAGEREAESARTSEQAGIESQAKSDFLSKLSHEIRTPLNVILGIAEIQLQNETLIHEVRDAFERISSAGDLLLGIINDILDLSKMEAGKFELREERYDISSLINDIAQLNVMSIGSKPIEFRLIMDENAPAAMSGDELRIKQILNNLLSNAFKYTESGKVELSVYAETCGDGDNATIVFVVSDTGQGMTEEQLGKLFDENARFDMDANRTTEGAGLGMSILKNLIQMMDGEIFIESVPGKGSVFTVKLPQRKVGSDVIGREAVENLQQFRTSSRTLMKRVQITRESMPYGSVLIVDDVESNIYVARGLLLPYELKIDSALSGFAAIEKIKNGCVYDIIFMDHMMPKMDGIEATRIIKSLGYQHPIVALTANAVVGQADVFLGNGFDDFISKPIDVRQLNTVLNKFVRGKYNREAAETAERQNVVQKDTSAAKAQQPEIDPKFVKYFLLDAAEALAGLESIMEKAGEYDEGDIQTYIVHVHGMKGALAYVHEPELTAFAAKLERAGRGNDTFVMEAETSAFLEKLREVVKKLTPQEEDKEYSPTAGDFTYLREKLLLIKDACEVFDQKQAKDAQNELAQTTWPGHTNELLSKLGEYLLNGDFEEASGIADSIIGKMEETKDNHS